MLYVIGGLLLLCVFCAFVLVCSIQIDSVPDPSDGYERREYLIRKGRTSFRTAIACWAELCELEGYDLSQWEAEELSTVILHDPPAEYDEAIERIMDKWRPTRTKE